MAVVASGGAIATSLRPGPGLPEWAPAAIAFGFAVLGVAFTLSRPPRPIDELRARVVAALVLVPVVAIAVWGIVALLT